MASSGGEAITLKRLGLYFNPIVLLNTRGFYMWSLVDRVEDVLPTIAATPKWREDAREYAVVRQAAG